MSEGYLEDDATVECPLHAASFCLKTGKALCLPATDPLTTYPVHVEGGDIFIDLPEVEGTLPLFINAAGWRADGGRAVD